MRFHYGPIPEEAGFEPESQGSAGIREPKPLLMNVLAIPAAFLMLGLMFGLLSLVWEGGPQVIWRVSEGESPPSFLLILATILLSVPLHELLHALAHPKLGRSSNSILGLWLSRGLFYAHYEGEISRNRFLAILAMPFLILSLLPVIIIALFSASGSTILLVPRYLVIVVLVNGVLSSGDALGFTLILSQIPGSAVVRNKGWQSYWKRG
jgi:hypothetical protein